MSFIQRFVRALIVVTVCTVLVVGGGYWFAARKVAAVSKVSIDTSVLQPGGNYLLIGSDTRAFVDNPSDARAFGTAQNASGQRSDTIMVAHVDSDGSGVIVSFPRDLWVAIPGIGHAKINAAFNAGPQRVIETIEQDFDVPISHYLQVDFSGFRNIVNAIGTIPIYFGAPARDRFSGLSITQAGCAHLNGDQALAYVRSRYYESFQNGQWRFDPESDLGRIKRQQYFLRTLAAEALKAAEHRPWRASKILDTMLANLQRDPKLNFSALRALAYAFHGGSADLQTMTLPARPETIDGQSALALDDAKAAPILARLRGAPPSSGKSSASTNLKPGDVRVAVENGSGRTGAGSTMLGAFARAGFKVVAPATNADKSDYTRTEVHYRSGGDAAARLVNGTLGGTAALVAGDPMTTGADVTVVIGRDLPEVSTPTTAPSGTTAPAATSASSAPVLAGVGC